MSEDIQILPLKEGEFTFSVLGKADDSGLMLLQRVFVLLLNADAAYRPANANVVLLDFLKGGNYPEDGVMTSLVGLCCSDVLLQLDDSDRERIASLTGSFSDGKIICTLQFTDGTTLTGVING